MFPQSCPLPNRKELILDKVREVDAEPLLTYLNRVGGQTDFLSYGLNGFHYTLEQSREVIADCLATDYRLSLAGKIDGQIIAHLFLDHSPIERLKHVADLGITVDQAYWGQGIGRQMMLAAIGWARSKAIIKIMFLVDVDNARAIRMYESLGAVVEGRISKAAKINDEFHDNFLMAIAL